jgi:hypothetical protein
MDSNNTGSLYTIWGADCAPYGPVELPTLVDWIKDERVGAETWVFEHQAGQWRKAVEYPELACLFKQPAVEADVRASSDSKQIKPGALRRLKIFAELPDCALERLSNYLELYPVRQWQVVVRQNEAGDAMYLVMEGELRVRLMIAGRESILATFQPGEFFGEIALFDQGPRSADVVANKDCLLLRLPVEAFQKLMTKEPEVAAPLLYAIGKTLTARIRADNKRFRDSVVFARTAGGPAAR